MPIVHQGPSTVTGFNVLISVGITRLKLLTFDLVKSDSHLLRSWSLRVTCPHPVEVNLRPSSSRCLPGTTLIILNPFCILRTQGLGHNSWISFPSKKWQGLPYPLARDSFAYGWDIILRTRKMFLDIDSKFPQMLAS
jgi:hypothetical protein